ncbi:Golgi SNAP receptor complex member 2-like [Limulus polyphemus]|uniref:Golgi SNAP receptor complex member 2-like n=1 Tax=Limulus polyphemus TaxID=6850 RepID=A0ABM1BS44_LIMPO|nr:Golgi SNAP receptor complex member 2-like [Limulus polyphemus]XP_013787597.1 Golgi SNAP receptor complex member 2-like [Limulus polyphemus]
METLYHQTNRLVEDVQHSFARLEHCLQEEAHTLENEVQARIDQITSNCERLDILVLKEPPVRRPNAKLRVDQLKYSCQHLQAALRNLQHRRYVRERELKEREQLLSRKFTPNDQDTSIYIDQALQQNTSLQNAHRGMDELLGTGSGILGNIRDQRQTLKGAHRKILDVANTLGISNTVMRLIEKRTYQDKFILFGGMIVTCVIMFLVVRYMYFS